MLKLITIVGSILVGVLLLASLALADEGPNCGEFNSAAEVREAVEKYGVDVYDSDGDRFACEDDFPPHGVDISDVDTPDGGDDKNDKAEGDKSEGENCNVETGEPGPGEGEFNAEGECVSQEGENGEPVPAPEGETPVPNRIDTGGGFCASHHCE